MKRLLDFCWWPRGGLEYNARTVSHEPFYNRTARTTFIAKHKKLRVAFAGARDPSLSERCVIIILNSFAHAITVLGTRYITFPAGSILGSILCMTSCPGIWINV